MTPQEIQHASEIMELHNQLVEAQMESERWKAKYDDIANQSDLVTNLMLEVVQWREAYVLVEEKNNLMEASQRREFGRDNQAHAFRGLHDMMMELLQDEMLYGLFTDFTMAVRLKDEDTYLRLKGYIEYAMQIRSVSDGS